MVEPLIVDNIVGNFHHRGESVKHPFTNNAIPRTEKCVDIEADLQALENILEENSLVHHLVAPLIVRERNRIPIGNFGLPVKLMTVYY